ncbi:MAG TPA: DUF1622 domain-containing protein [Pyrinomonadaceae bacterium]|nr:DUF1622 domain-containing protein [Pyrinomonadaceae bacterium]
MQPFASIILALQEGASRVIGTPQGGAVETSVINAVQWLRLIVETTGAAVICLGVVVAGVQFARTLIAGQHHDNYNQTRLTLARYLALALEFQLGADILSTAIAPSWDQIGKLGAIAVIRTGLNYFLMREMREERTTVKSEDGEEVTNAE